ncbi:MAG: phosphatase PAP2 family protein [Bacteroidales bacterium]|nr:phosphatase PAP2 family protein [Bacteroidales bacterium]
MSNILNTLNQWDTELFLCLNGAHNSFWDFVMYWASDKIIWIPVYLIFLFLLWRKFREKIWIILVFAALLVFLSDQISVHLFKDIFQRLRPCHEPELMGWIHLIDGKCGGSFGFYSSHASNIWAVAVFVLSMLGNRNIRVIIPILIWAMLISYSRIYLGVHYPGDILAGMLAGSLLGWMIARFAKNVIREPAIEISSKE